MARSICAAFNECIASSCGWQVDLHLWEDTLPSSGRPQVAINPLVDTCDLFIGLVWERWGHPTGDYSSGFQEEFERATARNKASGKPEIWLIFKNIDQSKMKDPGDQLKKVIEFRESQVLLNELQFKEVQDAHDWSEKLRTWLTKYIVTLPVRDSEQQQQAIATPVHSSASSGAMEDASLLNLTNGLPPQLKAASAALFAATADDALDLFDRDGSLSEFEVARLFLLSGTLISRKYTNLVFGTHEINLLYKHREKLNAAIDERIEIFRSIIGSGSDVIPGWFWFQDLGEQLIYDQLFKFATDDIIDDVRIGALDLLTLSRFEIPRESWPSLPLEHQSGNVRASAFNYLAEMGDESTIEYLDRIAMEADEKLWIADARDARFRILVRLNPDAALVEAISEDEFVSSKRMKLLEQHASAAGEQILLRGAESSWEQMRKLCARELARRGRLPIEVAHRLVQDSSLSVRAIALESLAKTGNLPETRLVRDALRDKDADSRSLYGGLIGGQKEVDISDVDSIIVASFSSQSVETTLAALEWFSVDALLAYKALALNHFESISFTVREDLANGFRRIREETLRRFEDTNGPVATRQLKSIFNEHDSFIELLQRRQGRLLSAAYRAARLHDR